VCEILHLAVREDSRRLGVALALHSAYARVCAGRKSRVWTGSDNIAALALYGSLGYVPDGWTADVMCNGK
jgi:GNAT superfamily N-acetyltransferase